MNDTESKAIWKALGEIQSKMSGLHCPHGVSHYNPDACPVCVPTSSDGYKELQQEIKHNWETGYKADESISNRLQKVEAQVISLNEHIGQLMKDMRKLEQAYKADAEVARDIIFEGAKRNEEIRQVKSECDTHCGAITCLENKVEKLETHFSGDYQLIALKLMPHKCPVCDGCGKTLTEAAKVAFDDILRAGLEPIKICKPCDGKGIVWG